MFVLWDDVVPAALMLAELSCCAARRTLLATELFTSGVHLQNRQERILKAFFAMACWS